MRENESKEQKDPVLAPRQLGGTYIKYTCIIDSLVSQRFDSAFSQSHMTILKHTIHLATGVGLG